MTAMRTVRVQRTFAASLPDAEALWYDTARWTEWIDGLDSVTAVEGGWPATGSTVRWRSGPAGRGSVTEHVLDHVPLEGQTVQVADDSIRGEQTIAFTPEPPGVRVELSLAYAIRRRSPLTPVIDALFIRRAMTDSLEQTLSRFGSILEAAHPPPP
jgi:polyketide cyclase/dehydrase/lipid transport protein